MSGYKAINSRCQNCNEFFQVKRLMTTVLNLDDGTEEFFGHRINNVKCTKCSSEFTFELPMVIFSQKNAFAIKVTPANIPPMHSPPSPAPHYLFCKNFRFREVTYQIEAVEKAKIFLDGLDDRLIEYIKLKNFAEKDAIPFEETNIVYESCDSDNMYFRKYNCDNIITAEYKIPISCVDSLKLRFNEMSENTWKIINRYTIEKYISYGG